MSDIRKVISSSENIVCLSETSHKTIDTPEDFKEDEIFDVDWFMGSDVDDGYDDSHIAIQEEEDRLNIQAHRDSQEFMYDKFVNEKTPFEVVRKFMELEITMENLKQEREGLMNEMRKFSDWHRESINCHKGDLLHIVKSEKTIDALRALLSALGDLLNSRYMDILQPGIIRKDTYYIKHCDSILNYFLESTDTSKIEQYHIDRFLLDPKTHHEINDTKKIDVLLLGLKSGSLKLDESWGKWFFLCKNELG